jgi:hypothetical protein
VHDRVVEGLRNAPQSFLGDKPADLTVRGAEARRLSKLMEDSTGFSFLRMGDGELCFLLAAQEHITGRSENYERVVNGTQALQNPAMGIEFAGRLRAAYERASYVDYHERLWPVSELLPRLVLNAAAGQHRNPDPETSYILLTWLECEFLNYCKGKRVGIAGAEAGLLQNLMKRAEFVMAAADFWPSGAEVHLHEIRNGGRNVSENYDYIKQDLIAFARDNHLDTVFLSLSNAAKVLCVEIAELTGVRMFDAGSMLCTLTYSGSPGNRASRKTHFPFLYRVPFAVWCDAMEETWPHLAPEELLGKVHAQLILEVQKKEVGWTHASKELDLSEENRAAFAEAHQIYLARYRRLFDMSVETNRERAHFLHFCGTHELTQEGRRFLRWFKAKSFASRLWRWNRQ